MVERSQIRGTGFGFLGLRGALGQGLGLGHAEFFQGAVVIPFAGVDDALEALEWAGLGGEGFGGIAGFLFRVLGEVGIDAVLPEFGFDAAHAAETPFVMN